MTLSSVLMIGNIFNSALIAVVATVTDFYSSANISSVFYILFFFIQSFIVLYYVYLNECAITIVVPQHIGGTGNVRCIILFTRKRKDK